MSGSMYLAASGAILQQLKLDVLSNNVANINTPGYKEDLPVFRLQDEPEDLLPNDVDQAGIQRQRILPYAPPFSTNTNFSSGAVKPTGNTLDLALNGDGFFTVQTDNGVRYTRQGNFRMNEDGIMTTQNGDPVLGQGGEISLEGNNVTIGTDGTVEVDGEIVDQLRLVRFDDQRHIKKIGDTMFEPADGFGVEIELDAENTSVDQGFIEMSNVNAVRAMTDMIEAMRVSQAYQKVIQSVDEVTSKTVNDV